MGLITILTNKIVLSVILTYVVASLIKVLFHYLGQDKWDIMVFLRTGGMPSTHTATVSAMTTSVYLVEGLTNLFFVCLVISLIIISDAVGVRRAAGKQAYVLNKMVDEFKYFRKFKTKRLHELLGHTPKQVFAGLLIGVIIARIIFIL
jgi:acid phosphatase family membrane protein YuiD